MIVSDDHAGLKAARKTVFPSVPWQRCYFHLSQNAESFARKMDEKNEITKSMRSIFSSNSKEEAKVVLKNAIKYWEIDKKHINFANWLEKNVEDSLTYFDFHEFWWSKIRTSNCIGRLNCEIKRRT